MLGVSSDSKLFTQKFEVKSRLELRLPNERLRQFEWIFSHISTSAVAICVEWSLGVVRDKLARETRESSYRLKKRKQSRKIQLMQFDTVGN